MGYILDSDRSHAPAWECSPGCSASITCTCSTTQQIGMISLSPWWRAGGNAWPFPPAPPRPPQLHGPAGSLRCSVWRGHSQTRRYAPQTPRAPISRQSCATRPCRRGFGVRAFWWIFLVLLA